MYDARPERTGALAAADALREEAARRAKQAELEEIAAGWAIHIDTCTPSEWAAFLESQEQRIDAALERERSHPFIKAPAPRLIVGPDYYGEFVPEGSFVRGQPRPPTTPSVWIGEDSDAPLPATLPPPRPPWEYPAHPESAAMQRAYEAWLRAHFSHAARVALAAPAAGAAALDNEQRHNETERTINHERLPRDP